MFAAVALCLYVAAALWLLYGLHYEIGDAVARTGHARSVVQSRDPHLASMGFYWPPLPVLLQAPLVLVLGPLGQAVLAGPFISAACGALTVIVLARICRSLGLSWQLSMALTAVYALNPITVFTAANGMSESVFLLCATIAMLGYIRWARERRTVDLVVLAAGLAGAVTVRYEALPFIAVLAVPVALQGLHSPRDLRDRGTRHTITASALLATAPALYTFGLWLFASLLIMKDPFYWLRAQAANGHTPANAAWLPHPLTMASILGYCGRFALVMAPGTVIIGPLLLLRRTWSGFVTGLGLLGALLMWPALIVYQLIAHVTYANPRYFEPAVLFITVAAAWVAAEHHRARGSLVGAFNAILASQAGGEWRPFGDDYGVARVYQWVPSKPTTTKRRP